MCQIANKMVTVHGKVPPKVDGTGRNLTGRNDGSGPAVSLLHFVWLVLRDPLVPMETTTGWKHPV